MIKWWRNCSNEWERIMVSAAVGHHHHNSVGMNQSRYWVVHLLLDRCNCEWMVSKTSRQQKLLCKKCTIKFSSADSIQEIHTDLLASQEFKSHLRPLDFSMIMTVTWMSDKKQGSGLKVHLFWRTWHDKDWIEWMSFCTQKVLTTGMTTKSYIKQEVAHNFVSLLLVFEKEPVHSTLVILITFFY